VGRRLIYCHCGVVWVTHADVHCTCLFYSIHAELLPAKTGEHTGGKGKSGGKAAQSQEVGLTSLTVLFHFAPVANLCFV
jgi:hypothetical protein